MRSLKESPPQFQNAEVSRQNFGASFEDVCLHFQRFAAALDSLGIKILRMPADLESKQARLLAMESTPIDELVGIAKLRAEMERRNNDPAAIRRGIARIQSELAALEEHYPSIPILRQFSVNLPISKPSLQKMSQISREILVFKPKTERFASAYLGDAGEVGSPESRLLGEQGQLEWTFHHHPGLRIPVPSFAFIENVAAVTCMGDLRAPLAPINAIIAGDGVTVYCVSPNYKCRSNDFYQAYLTALKTDHTNNEISAIDHFDTKADVIKKLQDFGLTIRFHAFADPTWEYIHELLVP